MLMLPDPDLRALAEGEIIVAAVDRATVSPGDEVELASAGPRPATDLKAAYRRWADAGPPPGTWSAMVMEVYPAAILDPEAGASRHILAEPPAGDLLVLRVYGVEGPVLSDEAFAARRNSLEGALSQ